MRDETITPHINYQINYPTLHQESERHKWQQFHIAIDIHPDPKKMTIVH